MLKFKEILGYITWSSSGGQRERERKREEELNLFFLFFFYLILQSSTFEAGNNSVMTIEYFKIRMFNYSW